ncbi:quaternary amine ABC transporter ATP-binding protein [Aurantimonas endophytica]|uniref:Quaternary amine transport ATP-binding protein n=1 Tax=Aurantimonas endophytica TaxID=1522175 RepID=A0A7W6MMS9_9HYPH|nr:betaine/proline/choline family ABC transporter ATP-binding protein [Aurantimonas endophytica]MBB4001157.1 glycine betaine/proline transport system ATP-binding protein [Aurantimonas endophytica]MCO6403189.1 betaine/proline/choline family ABC transporter ATP-binding protein [Aurantimonas endophytica]
MADVAIQIRNLYKIFGPDDKALVAKVRDGMTKAELLNEHSHVLGLKDINIDMPAGAIQVVMGLSGSGKSTLIRHINRLIEPSAGEVLIGGEDVVAMSRHRLRELRRHQISMVFQRFGLLPHKTVIDNVAYGLKVMGKSAAEQRDGATRWIDRVGLKGYEDNYPAQLSGGMQQRVGLARALATDADVLLMDEAFSALDPLIRTDMQMVLLDLQQELKKTIVFITHDLDEALRLGDRIAILRDGEIVQQGTGQEIVLNPADDYISSFVREVNRGRVIQVETVMERLPADGAPLEEGSLSIRKGTVLEEAARRMSAHGGVNARVEDQAGKPLGTLTMRGLMAAMVTPVVKDGLQSDML